MSASDRLRGCYVRAPSWVQSTGGRLVSLAPPALLYGRTFRQTQHDIRRSLSDEQFVHGRVQKLLRTLLARALSTPFYAGLLAGLDPASATIEDLAALPILTKDTVRVHADEMLAVPRSQLDEAMTSGSSAAVLSVYLDKDRSVREWAFVTHAWYRGGYRLGDRRAVLRQHGSVFPDPASRYWSWEPGMRELRLSPFRMVPAVMDEYLDLVSRYRIAFIHGYPSAIALLAQHARHVGWSAPSRLKGVLPISEQLLPSQRELFHEGFGAVSVVPFYGLTEKVAFATEAPDAAGEYSFEPLYGIAEVVDADGRPVGSGERGRLVGTGFISMGMPLIRYYTGDLATLVETPSPGNCWRLRVKDLTPARRHEYLVTTEGGLISPTVAYTHNRVVREFRFVQDEPGRATLLVVPLGAPSQEELEDVERRINTIAGGLFVVGIEVVGEIEPGPRGKRRFVEQHLDLSEFGVPFIE